MSNPQPLETTLRAVAYQTGVSIDAMRGDGRTPEIIAARVEFCGRARVDGYTLSEIAAALGRDSHGQVWVWCRRYVEQQREAREVVG